MKEDLPTTTKDSMVFRGKRFCKPVCRRAGHPKPYPGGCLICRREADKKRNKNPARQKARAQNYKAWIAKPGSKEKAAAWKKRRNASPERKAKSAATCREEQHQEVIAQVRKMAKPSQTSHASTLMLALAEVQAVQAKYGIIRVAYT